jgi:DNA-binding MarR family transcriptional regulator
MTPQAHRLLSYLYKNDSITARTALLDLNMTSATLARRICDLEEAGVTIERVRKRNPETGARYTEYTVLRFPVRRVWGPTTASQPRHP